MPTSPDAADTSVTPDDSAEAAQVAQWLRDEEEAARCFEDDVALTAEHAARLEQAIAEDEREREERLSDPRVDKALEKIQFHQKGNDSERRCITLEAREILRERLESGEEVKAPGEPIQLEARPLEPLDLDEPADLIKAIAIVSWLKDKLGTHMGDDRWGRKLRFERAWAATGKDGKLYDVAVIEDPEVPFAQIDARISELERELCVRHHDEVADLNEWRGFGHRVGGDHSAADEFDITADIFRKQAAKYRAEHDHRHRRPLHCKVSIHRGARARQQRSGGTRSVGSRRGSSPSTGPPPDDPDPEPPARTGTYDDVTSPVVARA